MVNERYHDRPLLVALAMGDRSGPCLVIDLRDPSRLLELDNLDHLDPLPPQCFLVVDGISPHLESRQDNRVLVPRAFLDSLLDPLAAGRERHSVVEDRLAAEQQLRRIGATFWDGIRRWAKLDDELRRKVRDLLAPYSKAHADLLDLLTHLASRPNANPFTAWETMPPFPGKSPPMVPLEVPAETLELEAWMNGFEGLGALYGPGFRSRVGQGLMAGEVLTALQKRQCTLIEAGTGVGKTLAYLVPLLRLVAGTNDRAVVSTYTRALQAQILDQDLPRLQPLFPDVSVRRLMGRSNYLCRTRKLRYLRKPIEGLEDAWAQASFRLWIEQSVEGMREEVEQHPALRRDLTELFDSPEPCSPAVCYGRDECSVQRARRLAREASLVVVNHSLLMNDCASRHALVGEYRHLVVDEAHRLPQVALDTFSLHVAPSRATVLEELIQAPERPGQSPDVCRRAAKGLMALGESGQRAAENVDRIGKSVLMTVTALHRWLEALDDAHGSGGEIEPVAAAYHGRVRVYDRLEVFGVVAQESSTVQEACASVGAAASALAGNLENVDGIDTTLEEDLASLMRAAELVQSLAEDLFFLTGVEDEDWVVWLEPDGVGRIRSAGATRLDAGELLREQWQTSKLAPVVTSATLSIGEDFAHMNSELGLSRPGHPARTALVPSPFDFEAQSLYVVPTSFPAPDHSDHVEALADLVLKLQTAVARKTMVLFTSYKALQAARAALEKRGGDHEFRSDASHRWNSGKAVIITQGQGVSAAEMLARFRLERQAILLGTNTFWEGVDLPGGELEILIVPRLPFLVPTDPWVEARSERMKARGENPFIDFIVRDAVLRLRQGVGRLLRTESDRGVVLLLDPRLHGKPYGMTFLKALPVPVRFATDAGDAIAATVDFFQNKDRERS